MVTLNREKLKELILYIAARNEGDDAFGVTRLTKVLLWADFEQFRQTGRAIAGGSYVKMRQGPLLDGQHDLLKSMEGHGALRLERHDRGEHTLRRPVALHEPNLELFTPDELALVSCLHPL
jgi:hypothetical protein